MQRHIAKELKDFELSISKAICIKHPFKDRSLNATQIRIIGYLLRNQNRDVCQKELEQEMNLKKASITGSLDSLEEKGLIVRKTSDEDKRKKFVILTDEILDKKKEIENRINKVDEKITKGINDEELETFFAILDKMKKNLEK